MPLIVWRWSVFQLQVVGVKRTVGKRNLIVISVVEGFGQRVRGAELIMMREAFLDDLTTARRTLS